MITRSIGPLNSRHCYSQEQGEGPQKRMTIRSIGRARVRLSAVLNIPPTPISTRARARARARTRLCTLTHCSRAHAYTREARKHTHTHTRTHPLQPVCRQGVCVDGGDRGRGGISNSGPGLGGGHGGDGEEQAAQRRLHQQLALRSWPMLKGNRGSRRRGGAQQEL